MSFTDDELLDLAFLVHDKAHLAGGYGAKVPGIEKALATLSERAPILWRSPHATLDIDKYRIGDIVTFEGYTSWTESLNFAKWRGGRLLRLEGATAYPYWRHWTEIKNLEKQQDPASFKMNGCDHTLKTLDKEREWITPLGFKAEVVDSTPEFLSLVSIG